MFSVRRFQHMIDRLAASALPTIYISMSHVAFFVSLFTFRPYCSSYVDAAYCYRRSRVVYLSRSWALQKRLNWSRCRLGCALGCARKHVLDGGVHIGSTWFIPLNLPVRRRCGLMSNYVDHLFHFSPFSQPQGLNFMFPVYAGKSKTNRPRKPKTEWEVSSINM